MGNSPRRLATRNDENLRLVQNEHDRSDEIAAKETIAGSDDSSICGMLPATSRPRQGAVTLPRGAEARGGLLRPRPRTQCVLEVLPRLWRARPAGDPRPRTAPD